MKKKILITGGAGFIGSHLKRYLDDCDIVTVGRNKNEDYKIDLSDSKLEDIIKDFSPDIVCHFASGSNILRAEENKEKEYKDTVLSTKTLIQALNKFKNITIIYLSSQAVYGLPENLPVVETQTAKPISVYGKNKLEAEKIITQSGLNYLIFRISSIYGLGQNYEKSGVIAKFINRMKNNESPVVFNSLNSFSDFIYIDDVINAIVLSIQKNIQNEIFNLGSGKALTLKEILDILYKYFSSAPKPVLETNLLYPHKEYKGLYLNTDKIKSRLNWSCKYNIEDGLREMLSVLNLTQRV
ncbi:MAG: hypothetical protein A3I68_07040 [Candidatus Melainabacteria bacterium RIFCSPLOWO2_02_FULL_35_15]|nr:MAG: hypothetical protein A3F80_04540 [Candidatus Melainabacteria bacterium RIFCSPLOWO2_12_FULL_35_11]OGI13548.1 MAG: hypothetical protein A3I68_07040 [Candidatus Melainabacteria bacterium RIFCSPLOWO2_02_FULL_35_15]